MLINGFKFDIIMSMYFV